MNEDFDILGYNEECVEEFQGEEPNTQRKGKENSNQNESFVRNGKLSICGWETKQEGKTVMKCIYFETHKVVEWWGIDIGFSTIQHDSLVVHANSSIHKLSQARMYEEQNYHWLH